MVEKIVLPNGVRLVHEHMPQMRSCALGLWVESGARHEPKELCGISHYIEHMLFKGTETRTAAGLAADFDAIGGQVNAFTTKEHTCFYCRTLDSHLPEAAELLCDMFFHSVFADRDMDLERQVIIEEIGMYEDTPEDLVSEILTAAVYDGYPLGRPILGTKETLAGMKGETLLAYQKKCYTPENTVVALCGSYTDADLKMLADRFSAMEKRPAPQRDDAQYQASLVTRKKDIEQNHLMVCFPALPAGSDRRYDLQVLNNAFGGGMSSRLFQKVREEKGLCYAIYSFSTAYVGTGVLGIYTALSQETELSALRLIREEIERLLDGGLTEDELRRNKEQLKANVIMGMESTSSRMMSVARGEYLYGRAHTPEDIIRGFDAVTLDSVQSLAREIFQFDKASLSAVGQVKDKETYKKAF